MEGGGKEMSRLENWPRFLSETLTEKATQDFVWGENDCCLFVADVLLAITGIDYGAALRGTYSTEAEALAIVQEHGDIEGFLDYILGAENQIRTGMVGRGDVVVTTQGSCGIIDDTGRRIALYAKDKGLVRVSKAQALYAWRIE
jgi:hypothetical protein